MKPHSDSHRRRLLDETLDAATVVARLTPAAMALIHDSLNGHPRAARYDRNATRTTILWCDHHQRDHGICKALLEDCGGTPITSIDPTGDAAMRPDEAAQAQREIDRDILTAHTALTALARRVTVWQPASSEMQRPDMTAANAPDGWCTQCFLASRSHEPVSEHHTGQVCRWCGDFRTTHGVLPPLPVLRWRHDGRNVTQNVIDRHLRTPTRRTA